MDDWLDDSRDNASYEKDMWRRNLQHISEKHKNMGFKEVVSDAKDLTLQKGFNCGFHDGVVAGKSWGQLQGLLSALNTAPADATRLSNAQRSTLAGLLAEVDTLLAKRDFPAFSKSSQSKPLIQAAAAAVGRPEGAEPAKREDSCCGGGCGGDSEGSNKGACARAGCTDEGDLWQRCRAFLNGTPMANAIPALVQ